MALCGAVHGVKAALQLFDQLGGVVPGRKGRQKRRQLEESLEVLVADFDGLQCSAAAAALAEKLNVSTGEAAEQEKRLTALQATVEGQAQQLDVGAAVLVEVQQRLSAAQQDKLQHKERCCSLSALVASTEKETKQLRQQLRSSQMVGSKQQQEACSNQGSKLQSTHPLPVLE
eukprot:gene133-309_t